MKLHQLTLTGFGPFRDRQDIDFDDLSASGLFLIEGATGSGKTTIIDAVVYALFGVGSAGEQDTTTQRVRSKFCGDADPTGVACEFSVEGRRFRITRVPSGARDPEEPTRAAKRQPAQVLTEYAPEGEPIVRTGRQEVTERVVEVLGMSIEQFRQLVVLPQGRFAELLRQTPADRLKSLEPLLENGVVAAVQADLEKRGLDARRTVAEADALVLASAEQLHGRLSAWLVDMPPEVAFTDAAVDDEIRCARVADIMAALLAEAERTQTAREQQAHVVESRRATARAAAEAWALIDAVATATSAVDTARSAAWDEDADLDEAGARAQLGQLLEFTGSLRAHAAWEAEGQIRMTAAAQAREEIDDLRADEERLADEVAPLPEALTELEAQRSTALTMAAQSPALHGEVQRLTELRAKASGLARARHDEERLAAAARTADTRRSAAEDSERAAEEHLLGLLHDQRAAAAVLLAERLVHGEPCPVCGATEHPTPAASLGGAGTVSEDALDAAQTAVDTARDTAATAVAAAVEAQSAHQSAAQQLAALEGALGTVDLATIDERLADSSARAAAAASAEERVAALDGEITAARDRIEDIRTRRHALATRIIEAASSLAATSASEEQRRQEIAMLTGGAGTATEALAGAQRRAERLSELASALGDLATAEARVPADLADIAPAQALDRSTNAAAELAEADDLLVQLTEQSATATARHDESVPLAAQLRAAVASRAQVLDEAREPLRLAALVGAGNPFGLQLRSYALQQRFASVLDAASLHLERMSGGRFTFLPSFEKKGTAQSGLGITLMDSWTGHVQEPKSLSGGETFYASLALALGLADIVRNEVSGSALETLFVDEGFGSLDQDTLAQVLDELDALRAGNRVVGVVSHVTEMKESIPERIEVRRQADRTSVIHRDRS